MDSAVSLYWRQYQLERAQPGKMEFFMMKRKKSRWGGNWEDIIMEARETGEGHWWWWYGSGDITKLAFYLYRNVWKLWGDMRYVGHFPSSRHSSAYVWDDEGHTVEHYGFFKVLLFPWENLSNGNSPERKIEREKVHQLLKSLTQPRSSISRLICVSPLCVHTDDNITTETHYFFLTFYTHHLHTCI